MSFGFSIGDFLAVGKLIKDISSCLRDAGGSKDEYQELLRELGCLQITLGHLKGLYNSGPSSDVLRSIELAVSTFKALLGPFLLKIRKFDKSLGLRAGDGVVKSTSNKLRWGLGQKEEVDKLRDKLNFHIGIINILLNKHILEKMGLEAEKAAAGQLRVESELENTRGAIEDIGSSFAMQASVTQSIQSMVTRISDVICVASWDSLVRKVSEICTTTQQTYAVVLEIRNSLQGPDTRWSFFQAPLVVEDPLGYKFPVPSEYDVDALDAIVKHRFRTGPGSFEVKFENYEYLQTGTGEVLFRQSMFPPGAAITMAIVLILPEPPPHGICPVPGCHSNQTVESPGGGRTWYASSALFHGFITNRLKLHMQHVVLLSQNKPTLD
ncbi:hypothetical protein F5Y04DRAFT_162316 [Hypomontagnella monticulosa]|nr:hypothetical protein F5Y04DRAFT_162316 [Hypomontagnella monticulosa]